MAFAELNPLAGACFAVIVVLPTLTGVTVRPEIEATDGSAIENVHIPGELDVGGTSENEDIASFATVVFVKLPIVGVIALIVSVVVVLVESQLLVANWVALIVTTPPSNKVTVAPLSVAIPGVPDKT